MKTLIRRGSLLGALPLLCLAACEGKTGTRSAGAPPDPHHLVPRIVRVIPHDGRAFTQGLCIDGGVIYESDGLYGESGLRMSDTSGRVLAQQPLPPLVFAEGCALSGGSLFQLTWRERRCYVYSLSGGGLRLVDSLAYDGEGWGLCTAGGELLMSNGSDTLYARDRQMRIRRKTAVTCGGKPLVNLNEIEFANGSVYANVWYSDFIFEIDPASGAVERIYDCAELVAREKPDSDEKVLNGIAFCPASGLFYCTGKKWNNIYVVDLPRR